MTQEVLDMMLTLAGEGMTMVVVSHEKGFARATVNRMILMDKDFGLTASAINAKISNPPRTPQIRVNPRLTGFYHGK